MLLALLQPGVHTGDAAATGAASVLAVGASTFAGVGSSAGAGTVTATSRSTFNAVGSSAGAATANAIGTGITAAVGSAAGSANVAATGAATHLATAVASGAGQSTALGYGLSIATGMAAGAAQGTAGGAFYLPIARNVGIRRISRIARGGMRRVAVPQMRRAYRYPPAAIPAHKLNIYKEAVPDVYADSDTYSTGP